MQMEISGTRAHSFRHHAEHEDARCESRACFCSCYETYDYRTHCSGSCNLCCFFFIRGDALKVQSGKRKKATLR